MKFFTTVYLHLILAIFFSSCSIITVKEINPENLCDASVYVVKVPHYRIEHRKDCFAHEYLKIHKKRTKLAEIRNENSQTAAPKAIALQHNPPGNHKPKNLIGLGLSGGGIRSNAFQLGMLSGLHANHLLHRIDYIASVSGGSWANGSFWTWDGTSDNYRLSNSNNFFNDLNKCVKNNSRKGKACKVLRSNQSDFVDQFNWSEEIKKNNLFYNPFFGIETLSREHKNSERYRNEVINTSAVIKPYPIFLASHTVMLDEWGSGVNFPFEITPDYLGTIVDCKSDEGNDGSSHQYPHCSALKKFFFNIGFSGAEPEKGFFIKLDLEDEIKVWTSQIKSLDSCKDPVCIEGNYEYKKKNIDLADALSASSAVVGKLLQKRVHFSFHAKEDLLPRWRFDQIRRYYNLADGGKADNLGLVPLVERGADLIILSQMGHDPGLHYTDMKISVEQAERLLKRTIDPLTPEQEKKAFIWNFKYKNHVFFQKDEGDIWLVKPSHRNISPFLEHLQYKQANEKKVLGKDGMYKKPYSKIIEALKKDLANPLEDRFPHTKTMKITYPKELIFAYYLLGKFVAEKEISPKVKTWLKSNDGHGSQLK